MPLQPTLPAPPKATRSTRTPRSDSAAPSDAPDCSPIADIGPTVTRTANAEPLPAMTGGAILDGTYVLTSNVVYAATTTPGRVRKSTMEIAGNRVRYVDNYDGGPDSYFLMSASTNGATKWSLIILCPPFVGGESLEFDYTATDTELAILADPGRIRNLDEAVRTSPTRSFHTEGTSDLSVEASNPGAPVSRW